MSTIDAVRTRTYRSARLGDLAVLLHQVRYEQLSFWRNPQAMIFTFVFPVAMMAIFGIVFGGDESSEFFFGLTGLQYYTPTIAAISVLGACYAQLAIALTMRRGSGVLKRLHATPLPAWIHFAGLSVHSVVIAVVNVLLIIAVGALFGAPLPARPGPLLMILVLGAISYCSIGVAVASVVRNAEAAPAVVQFVQLPVVFISGGYFPVHSEALNTVAELLPVKPFTNLVLSAFTVQSAARWQDLVVLSAWGLVGAVVAVRWFRWDPRP